MMLRHLGEDAAAARIERALTTVLSQKKQVTRDLGGTAGTKEMTEEIIARL
jgi:tartrate dehydrogenase/decarboxylase / D-malate dehydrogenase